jgi:hypothetical protein
MKKIFFVCLLCAIVINCKAQWVQNGNNRYYTNSIISIGTPSLLNWGNPSSYNSLSPVFGINGSYVFGNTDRSDAIGGVFGGNNSGFFYNSNTYQGGLFSLRDGENGATISIGDYGGYLNNTCIILSDSASTLSINAVDSTSIYSSYINAWSENFGINTGMRPISTFQVNPNSSSVSIGSANGAALNYGTGFLGFNAARAQYPGNWTIKSDGYHNGGGVMYTSIINGEIYFAPIENTGTSQKTLTDNDVRSRIAFRITPTSTYAKQIIVTTTGWPDYVFKSIYKLKSLSNTKSYIDKNHHLSGMPTAKDVEANGVNLGEMSKLLTKKVEELTLYLIEKDNQIKKQQEINGRQNSKLTSQQEQINQLKMQMSTLIKRFKIKQKK